MNRLMVVAAWFVLCGVAGAQEPPALTPRSLQAALAAKPEGAEAERLAERIRAYFGGSETLQKGAPPKVDELTVAWALEAAQLEAWARSSPQQAASTPAPRVVADVGAFSLPLTKVGTTGLYAGVAAIAHGTAFTWHYEAGDRRMGGGQLEVYETHPDSREQPGVPKGTVTQMPPWESKIFSGTRRDWWVYVPAQYRPESPAAVMVFQDGAGAKDFVPVAFDNLIAKGDVPVTVGVFIQPGTFLSDNRSNRSFEYDTLSDQYVRFLLEEMLPEVEKTVKLRHDAASRAIAGASSGGICAFTAAWERPGEFSKVLSWIGSFTNIASGKTVREGGHNYAALVRKTAKKPIRVFLQDGANDLDNIHGNWPLANLTLAKSLAFAGYDYRFEYGQGFHSNRHGRAMLPDTLRWLWRDYRATQTSNGGLPGLSGAASHENHEPGRPRQLRRDEARLTLQVRNEDGHFRRVPIRPVRLQQEVIDQINPAWPHQGKCSGEVRELPGPAVRVDQVEPARLRLLEERGAVGQVKADAAVGPEMASSHLERLRVNLDRMKLGPGVHSREQPGGADSRSGAELQKSSSGLGCRKRTEQGAGLPLGRHRKSDAPGLLEDGVKGRRSVRDLEIVHLQLQSPLFGGLLNQLGEALEPGLFFLRAGHPVGHQPPIPRRLRLEERPRFSVRLQFPQVIAIKGRAVPLLVGVRA
jgi:enterochelin esterase family protein